MIKCQAVDNSIKYNVFLCG